MRKLIGILCVVFAIPTFGERQSGASLRVEGIIVSSYEWNMRSDDGINITLGGEILTLNVPPGKYIAHVKKANSDSQSYSLQAQSGNVVREVLSNANYGNDYAVTVSAPDDSRVAVSLIPH